MGTTIGVSESEFSGAEFGDRRLNERVKKIAGQLEVRPDAGFPSAMTVGELEAFYRFLSNDRVDFDSILRPHVEATVARASRETTVLSVEDTTTFDFSHERRDLGRGLFAHVALGVTLTGTPVGVLDASPWARAENTVSQQRRRGEIEAHHAAQMPSEMDRWLAVAVKVETNVNGRTSVVHVMDSEADDYKLVSSLVARRSRFVLRSAKNRRIVPQKTLSTLKALVASEPMICQRDVALSKRGKATGTIRTKRSLPRETREATLSIGAVHAELRRPPYYESGGPLLETLSVAAVFVREETPPVGATPVEWVLLTTEPISTQEEVLAIVDMYRNRWRVEELFKALKTGCAYEKRQLESYRTLVNALALLLPIAWSLLRLRSTAREDAATPAETVLSAVELEVLRHKAEKPLPKRPTVTDVMLAIARMGGHLKQNGPPGWQTLGRGYLRLLDYVDGFLIAKRCDQS